MTFKEYMENKTKILADSEITMDSIRLEETISDLSDYIEEHVQKKEKYKHIEETCLTNVHEKEPKFKVGDVAYHIYQDCEFFNSRKIKVLERCDNSYRCIVGCSESTYLESELFTKEELINKIKEL
jgi:hypothetical protein